MERSLSKTYQFSLSDQMSVDTWDDKEVAVIKGKGYVLGNVSSVKREDTRDDRQSVGLLGKAISTRKGNGTFTSPFRPR